MNLAGFLNASARTYGDRPAVVVGPRMYLDYAALARASAGLGGAIRHRMGLNRGDSVLLAMSNNRDYLTVLFSCWQAGLTAVPVNARLHPREIAYIATDARARLAFATSELADGLTRELPSLPVILPESREFAAMTQHDPVTQATTAPSDIAWIFYTSGTTGRPKGALLSHRNLATMAIAYLADVDYLTPADSLLHLAATSHASGLFGLSFIAKAGANILPEAGGYDPTEMAAIIAANHSLSFFAPAMLLDKMAADASIRAAPLNHIRTILTGAGPIYVEDLRRWLDAFGPRIWNGYGQGESPCTITALPKEELWDAYAAGDAARMGSVGIARTGIALRIVRPDGSEADPDEVGEVLVQGDTVMSGYLNLPGASAETLRDGWLHTGDLARVDARGYLTLLDRKKDLIITGGMNVYAREVEELLLEHPSVAECAVIGVRDAEWGESVVALIVPRSESLDTRALDSFCLERLARFKRPKQYRVMNELPKNAAGKVLKAELRRMLSDAAGEESISQNRSA